MIFTFLVTLNLIDGWKKVRALKMHINATQILCMGAHSDGAECSCMLRHSIWEVLVLLTDLSK